MRGKTSRIRGRGGVLVTVVCPVITAASNPAVDVAATITIEALQICFYFWFLEPDQNATAAVGVAGKRGSNGRDRTEGLLPSWLLGIA
ncbi:hypothetical protein AAHE18_05G183500 [Arachis hypogaea]